MSTRSKRDKNKPFVKLDLASRLEIAVDQSTGEKVMGLHRTPPGGGPANQNGVPDPNQHQQQQQQHHPQDDPSGHNPTAPPPPETDEQPDLTTLTSPTGTPHQPSSTTRTPGTDWRAKINSANAERRARRTLDEQLEAEAQQAEAARLEEQHRQAEEEQRQAEAEEAARLEEERQQVLEAQRQALEQFEREKMERDQEAERLRRQNEKKAEEDQRLKKKAEEDQRLKDQFHMWATMSQRLRSSTEELNYDDFLRQLRFTSDQHDVLDTSDSDVDWDDLYDGEVENAEQDVFGLGSEKSYELKDPKTFDSYTNTVLKWTGETNLRSAFERMTEDTHTRLKQIIDTSKALDAEDRTRLAFMIKAATLQKLGSTTPSTMLYSHKVGKAYVPIIAIPALPGVKLDDPATTSTTETYYRPHIINAKKDRVSLNMEKLDHARLRLLIYGSILGMEVSKPRNHVRMALVYYYMSNIVQMAMMEVVFTMVVYETLNVVDKNLADEHKYRLLIYSALANHWQKASKFMKTSMLKIPQAGQQILLDGDIQYVPLYQIPTLDKDSERNYGAYSIPSKGIYEDARVLYAHRLLQQKTKTDWLVARFRKLVKKKFTDEQANRLIQREAAMDRSAHVENNGILKATGVNAQYTRNNLREAILAWLRKRNFNDILTMDFEDQIPDAVFLAITYSLDYRCLVATTYLNTLKPRERPATDSLKTQMLMVAQYQSLEECSLQDITRPNARGIMEQALRWANTGMILQQWDNITREQLNQMHSGVEVPENSSYKQRANSIGYNALVFGKIPQPSELSLPSYDEAMRTHPRHLRESLAATQTASTSAPSRGASAHQQSSNPNNSRGGRTIPEPRGRFDFSPIPEEDEEDLRVQGNHILSSFPPPPTHHGESGNVHSRHTVPRTIPISATGGESSQPPPTANPKRSNDQPNWERFTDEPMLPHQRRVYVGHTENAGWEATPLQRPSPNDPPEVWHNYNLRQAIKKDLSEEIPVGKFTGDISKFIDFWELFTAIIDHNPHMETIAKFIRLKRHLGDEPLRKISFLDTTAANYTEAKRIIVEHYGRIDDIYKIWESKFIAGPNVTREATYAEMENFYCKVRRLIISVKTFCPQKLNDRTIIDNVERKIDRRRFMAWRKFLRSFWREVNYCEEVYNENTYKCLLRFLKDECEDIREAEKYNDSQKAARAAAVENPKKFKTLISSAKNATSMMVSSFKKSNNKSRDQPERQPNRKPRFPSLPIPKKQSPRVGKCLFCKMTHDLKECKNTTVDQRIAILEKEGRCKICFKKHPLNACPSKKTCEKCNMKNHNTAIHKDLASRSKSQSKHKK